MADVPVSPSGRTETSSVKWLLYAIRDVLDAFVLGLERFIALRVAIGIAIIVLMANLDALVGLVLSPGIPYLDPRHLVSGGISALVTTILFGLLSIYAAVMKRAAREIRTLKGLLPICARCNKIRTPDNQWDLVEKFISERTEATFTHGLCPDCARTLYPQMYQPPSHSEEPT